MDTYEVIKNKIEVWLTKRASFMSLAYLMQTPNYCACLKSLIFDTNKLIQAYSSDQKVVGLNFKMTEPPANVISDQALDFYQYIKNILPNHSLITKDNEGISQYNADSRKYHEIIMISEDFTKDVNEGLLDELETLILGRRLDDTIIHLFDSTDNDPEIILSIIIEVLPNLKIGGIVYNNKKILCNSSLYKTYYE